MLVLITYDVNTEDSQGRRRLRLIAKQCVNYGQRVQNSVFECDLDAAQSRMLKQKLCDLIDEEKIAYGSIILATTTIPRLNILEARIPMTQKTH